MSAKRRSRKTPKGNVKKARAKKKVPTRTVGKAPRKASQAKRKAQRASAPRPKARKGSPPVEAAVRRAAHVAGPPAASPVEVVEVASLDVAAVRKPGVTS